MKTTTRAIKYFLIVASKDHVRKGIELSIAQACHGKVAPLKRMKAGDRVVYYSSKIKMEESGKANSCQMFTAIGTVKSDDKPYQVVMSEDFKPWRVNVEFEKNVKELSVHSVLDQLEFITNKKNWGMAFRFGFKEISESDFLVIENGMLN
ncbi:predicted protein [Naegleria gruberi]|uniref:Predicted protein n=1 Tax=Naegleria gruberi TaxID=5762 RepID=D2UX09_NAEGR|nr:uncharacterized protein NAEGRDRAFT_61595 [Naegleria gruberi]EFC50850.1 predicted protein [Naegleria gruberi]|eukprot:XP_002683594.1 predicted protein [Naegleria gruberi strain NEG-M]